MDQNPKQQISDRLQKATNVLVTVSSNPSVDQLSACIGFTLLLNKLGKHATAVFSGKVPSTIEFLKPESTLEKNTDSLRDFIIALDKSKADKLRYKVEDSVVKIFITPYKTSISEKDLEFSQGDFNVDLVVAIGVHAQQDLDQAITAHGRILHDATVACINNGSSSNLGSINWQDPASSSLCEMLVSLSDALKADSMDAQMATAFLTGIVAETERFSNSKTTPSTMSISAKLMSAGANQQLIATQLQPKPKAASTPLAIADTTDKDGAKSKDGADDGALSIAHEDGEANEATAEPGEPVETAPEKDVAEPADTPAAPSPSDAPSKIADNAGYSSHMTLQPPTLGGTLTANSQPEGYDPTTDPLSLPAVNDEPLLTHTAPQPAAPPVKVEPLVPSTPAPAPVADTVPEPAATPDLEAIRSEVEAATVSKPEPPAAFNAQILDPNVQGTHTISSVPPSLPDTPPATTTPPTPMPPNPLLSSTVPNATSILASQSPADDLPSAVPVPLTPPAPAAPTGLSSLVPPDPGLPPEQTGTTTDPTAPPPVPPPMMPPTSPTL